MEARIPFPICFIKNFLLNLNMTPRTAEINRVSECPIHPYAAKILLEHFNRIDFIWILFRKTEVLKSMSEQ